MGTTLGPKLVQDAKAQVEARGADEALTSRIDDAFGKIPKSLEDLGPDTSKAKDLCLVLCLLLCECVLHSYTFCFVKLLHLF